MPIQQPASAVGPPISTHLEPGTILVVPFVCDHGQLHQDPAASEDALTSCLLIVGSLLVQVAAS